MSPPNRQLIMSNMYPSHEQPVYGVFVRNMENAMAQRDWEVHRVVIAGRAQGQLAKLRAYAMYTFSGIRHLLSGRYTLVYIHFISLSALPLLLCWPLFRGKVVFNAHGSDLLPDTRIKSIMLTVMAPIIRRADMLVVPSDYYGDIARRRFPGLEVFISPSSGVDTRLFHVEQSPTAKDNGKLHLGFVSRIDPDKGWDTLLDALAELPDEIAERLQVTIVGGGTEQDQMMERIHSLGLADKISWHGVVPQKDLPSYYRALNVLVFPSRRPAESLGLVALEALSCGVPVIASNMAGPAGYINHDENGWLLPPGDSGALAAQIKALVAMPAERISVHARAAAESAREFDSESVADSLSNKLHEIVGYHE